jgi:two-component system NtrC family sensor kinase
MPRKSNAESIRLLRLALVSAMIFPLAAFLYAAWLDYRDVESHAQRQIERTAEVLNEHGLKVFEAVDRAIAEIAALVRDASDDELRAQQLKLHEDLKRIVATSTELKSLWIFDRDGKPIANSIDYPAAPANFSDREYFSAHVRREVGVHVSPLIEPRPPYGGAAFFGVSKRRPSSDGAFNGVIQASVLPEYFENQLRIG